VRMPARKPWLRHDVNKEEEVGKEEKRRVL
jgi:hypothetical protein